MKSALGLLTGIAISLFITAAVGENPFHVLMVLLQSAFGSAYDFGQVIYYASALIFTGLSVCIAFQGGLFNIGAEGQLIVGSLAMAAVGAAFPEIPVFAAAPLAIFVGMIAAGLWGFIPGFLRATRGSHEVIVTMMMNFVAAGIADYLIVGRMKNPDSQNPESTAVGANYMFTSWDPVHRWSPDSAANFSIVIGILLAIATWVFLRSTKWGFELRASGLNAEAASLSGINPKSYQIACLVLAGIFAGLIGMNEILGSAGKFRLGFSADFGFIGIAVALLARGNPLGVIASAFLFAVLQKGSSDLDLETAHITKDFAKLLQAIIILSVAGWQLSDWKKIKKILVFQKLRKP